MVAVPAVLSIVSAALMVNSEVRSAASSVTSSSRSTTSRSCATRTPFRAGTATDIQEVGRLRAGEFDDIHGGHGQTGAVDHVTDIAIQVDVV